MAQLQDLLPFTKKLSLLYIDEDAAMRSHICAALGKIFNLVDEASDGYEGLNYYKINQHDIIIMDSRVPNMAGQQLIKNIKTFKPDQHIVYTSADPITSEALISLVNHGINGYVKKPFKLPDLLDALQTSASVMYRQMQLSEELSRIKTLKQQQERVLEDAKAGEKKLRDDLLYERKRLGRLLKSQNELEKNVEAYEEQLGTVRNINELTGAASRHALQEQLKHKGIKSLIYMNIDNFDLINTVYGMGQGNKVLLQTVKRLNNYLPNNGMLFHITADEFVILLENPVEAQERIMADQVQALFREAPIETDGGSYNIIFSIGLDKGEGMQLFVHAKYASREAKVHGGGCSRYYREDSDYIIEQRQNLHWLRLVREAIKTDKLLPYYQPIINNVNSSTQHYEVLCRIEDKNGNLVEADQFIDIAIEAGLSTQISRIVIDKAFKHFSQNSYNFSININRYDMEEEYLEEFLLYKCARYKVDPERVYIELVAHIPMHNSSFMLAQIKQLRQAGFHIAVDDFGTEHSMLSRMLQVEADFIKIDSTFIQDLLSNKFHRMVVENIVEFARKTGIKTVAEHVDSEELYRLVHDLGVDYSQGYYIGKPLSSSHSGSR